MVLCSMVVCDLVGRIYHPEHFACSICGKNIAVGFDYFLNPNNNVVCDVCYMWKYAPKCCKCDEPLEEWIVETIGKQFHERCFRCCVCKRILQTSMVLVWNGEIYCHNDYWKLRRGSVFRKLLCYLWK
uniref:LIM zinc-binding domain-containing protein n=1 Tax=Trichuris muris TaxID=70415 RepID=A0A5S6QFD7_TRIMR